MERTNPTRKEHQLMVDLMILRNTLAANAPAARDRLRVNRYAWRDVRLAIRLVSKLQEILLETMPEQRRDYYYKMAKTAKLEVRLPGPGRIDRYLMISEEKLAAITAHALESECAMCIKEGREVKNCALRAALMEVAPPSEAAERDGFLLCPYRQAGVDIAQGKPSVQL